jgi:hypothetical protein
LCLATSHSKARACSVISSYITSDTPFGGIVPHRGGSTCTL